MTLMPSRILVTRGAARARRYPAHEGTAHSRVFSSADLNRRAGEVASCVIPPSLPPNLTRYLGRRSRDRASLNGPP